MLTTIAAIFWFGFACLGWIIVAVLMAGKNRDGNDPPDGPSGDLPPSPAAAAFMECRRAQREGRHIPHALEPPWSKSTRPEPLAA